MNKKKNGKDLVSTVETSISNVPDYLKHEGVGRGRENVDQTDLVLPRIKLLQPLSPEVQEANEGDAKVEAGHLFNTLTQQDYGPSIIFIPVIHFKSRIYWRNREEGGGIQCAAQNGVNPVATSEDTFAKVCTECTLPNWKNDAEIGEDKAPKCTIYYNFAIIIDGETNPIALSMERTKVKTAKKLLSLITYTGNLDMFAKKYKIGVTKEKNKRGTWYNYTIEPVGFVSPEEFKLAEAAYQSLKSLALSVEQERAEE